MSDYYFFITSVIVLLLVYIIAHAVIHKDATHTNAHFIIMCLYFAAMTICAMIIFNTVTEIKKELQVTEQQNCITQRRKEEYETENKHMYK